MRIVLDSGHGGNDPGAVGATGLLEKDITLQIVFQVADILMNRGLDVVFTRDSDKRVELSERVKIANNAKADLFVSVHINSANNSTATGTETFAFKAGTNGDRLAKSIQKNLVDEIKLPNRGVKYSNFTVLAKTTMPAALAEVAFINNPKEEALLRNQEFIEKAARGIAKGILEYLGMSYIPTPKPAPTKPQDKELQDIKVNVRGKNVVLKGVFKDGTNYAPIRDIAEMLGFKVDWDGRTQTVIIK